MPSYNSNQPEHLGSFRWKVLLAYRQQDPTFDEPDITEKIQPIAKVYMSIEQTGLMTFLNSEQLESPITHMAYMRWQSFTNLEMFNIVIRKQYLPDKSVRTETFRIRRVGEWIGRQRYIRLDLELEKTNAPV